MDGPKIKDLDYMDVSRHKRVLAEMDTIRKPHIGGWQRINDYVRPERGKFLWNNKEQQKLNTLMYNSRPYVASRTLSAGFIAGASSPAYPWLKLSLEDQDKAEYGPIKSHLETRRRILLDYLARSNFYASTEICYGDSADFGNTMAIIDENKEYGFSTRVASAGEFYFRENAAGDVAAVARKYTETVENAVLLYGKRCSNAVIDRYNNGDYSEKITLVQIIEPNLQQDTKRGNWRRYPFVSIVYQDEAAASGTRNRPPITDVNSHNEILEIKGYWEWPVPNIRWGASSGNVYAWGCGHVAIGECVATSIHERKKLQAIEKLITPAMQGPSTLKNSTVRHNPGGMTYTDPFSTGSGRPLNTLYDVSPNAVSVIANEIATDGERIDEAYFKPLFLALMNTDRREITAREIEEVHSERLTMIGPVLQRSHRDYLDTAVIRTHNILERRGAFPPLPPELQDDQIAIQYTSTLAYAQKSSGAVSLERYMGWLGNAASVYPELKGKLDPLIAADYYADSIGVPAKVIPDSKAAMERFQQESQAAEQAQAPEQMKVAAESAKLLSETDTSRSSALTSILAQAGLA
jgi:hypothetical protein